MLLTDFDKAMLGSHDEYATSRAQMALCGSIATLLDASGRWRDTPKSASPDAPSVQGRGFMVGSRIYELADGEFPEYDVLTAHLTALADLRHASVPGAAPPELPRFDPEFIRTVRARVEEAIAIARN
ncbi:MAG: hypothetical protein HZA52_02930 [Planctomycetes bacterium]|nr:hypothetical protein [Planctomycetota bacterium]